MIRWVNGLIKQMTCFDYALVKIAVFAFALMVAKLWPGILALDWWGGMLGSMGWQLYV